MTTEKTGKDLSLSSMPNIFPIMDAGNLHSLNCLQENYTAILPTKTTLHQATNSAYRCAAHSTKGKHGAILYAYPSGPVPGTVCPVPIITDNGEIAVIIEDNGWPGYSGFRATTVRCPLSDNWNSVIGADSPNRNIIFANTNDKKYKSAAPYLRKLQSGETIASWQGDYGDRKGVGESQYDMFVAVGDKDAKNFKAISAPFNLSLSQHSLWNSIAVVGDGSVIALGSIGDPNTGNAIKMIKGYPKTYFEADFGTPVLDGSASGDTWTYKNAQQVFMGNVTKNKQQPIFCMTTNISTSRQE